MQLSWHDNAAGFWHVLFCYVPYRPVEYCALIRYVGCDNFCLWRYFSGFARCLEKQLKSLPERHANVKQYEGVGSDA